MCVVVINITFFSNCSLWPTTINSVSMAEPIIQNAIKATNPMAPYTVKYCNISCPLANPEPIAKARYVPATVMIKPEFENHKIMSDYCSP